MYDVFLSYNSEDSEAVETIAHYLKDSAGFDPWFDKWETIPGEPRQRSLQRGLTNSLTCAVFVGQNGQGPWQQREVELALAQQVADPLFRVIPVLLPGASAQPALPPFLAGNSWIDCRDGLHDDLLWRLECGIRGVSPGQGRTQTLGSVLQTTALTSPNPPIEFVNRLDEIKFITNFFGSPSYLLISAPMGYGKTRLLQSLNEYFEQQGWFCISLQLSRLSAASLETINRAILQQMGVPLSTRLSPHITYEIGRILLKELHRRQQNNVLLLIDEAEAIPDKTAHELLNRWLPELQRALDIYQSKIQLRTLFAGRYICSWKQSSSFIPVQLNTLTPFDFQAVYQTVEKFSAIRDLGPAQQYKQEFASHVMHLTAGHPGCMAKILNRDFGLPIGIILSNEEEYFDTLVTPIIEEIKGHLSPQLFKIFETLSVVRRFNHHLLRDFIENKLIQWDGSEYELEEALSRTYVVTKKKSFFQDDITRRLLAIHLRKERPFTFPEVCQQAIDSYTKQLHSNTSFPRDLLAVELLFQKLYYLFYKEHKGKQKFFQSVPGVLAAATSGRDARAVLDSVNDCLKEDWEFRFTFNYLLRDGVYDDDSPFNEFLDHVTRYRQHV